MLIDFLEQTVYTQEGVLRGCANLTGSFQYKRENCAKSKKVGINELTLN